MLVSLVELDHVSLQAKWPCETTVWLEIFKGLNLHSFRGFLAIHKKIHSTKINFQLSDIMYEVQNYFDWYAFLKTQSICTKLLWAPLHEIFNPLKFSWQPKHLKSFVVFA